MRQTAGTLNRTWLTILGLLVLAVGAVLLLQAAGVLASLGSSIPSAQDMVVTGGLHEFFAQSWLVVLMVAIGVLVGILALLWIVAQIPRTNPAGAFRLHHQDDAGRTTCDPSVLAGAVEGQINALPGVLASEAVLRGTANEPDLSLRITVNEESDVQALLHRLETSTLPDLTNTLETPLYRRRLRIDVSGRTQRAGTVSSSTGVVLQ